MRTLARLLSRAALPVAIAMNAGCGTAPQGRPQAPQPTAALVPAPVDEAKFAGAVQQLLRDGARGPERLPLLAGVVRHQFARAADRFAAGDRERGLAAVRGALYLIRADELRPEMLDANADKALAGAYTTVAPLGQEGPALAFLQLRAMAMAANHPDQAKIAQHLRAMGAWMKDTRARTTVENTSANAKAFGERASLLPSMETLEEARASTDRWVAEALDFNERFRPGFQDGNRDQMVEAYRGVRTGAFALAGLFLRHGDAAGAARALERSEARRITSPELFERLQTASSTDGADAWQELAALYARAMNEGDEEELSMPQEIARGAAWGTMLEAYRRAPDSVAAVGPLAAMLPRVGLPEATPVILTPVVQQNADPELATNAVRLVLGILAAEDSAHDYDSVRRVYEASVPLLAVAEAIHARTPLDPSPADVRMFTATMHVRAGHPELARPMLEQALRTEPSLHGYSTLASVLLHAGAHAQALDAIERGLRAPDAAQAPVGRAEAHMLAFQVQRAKGDRTAAGAALAQALRVALEARERSRNDRERSACERLLARIAYHYGDRAAWHRAIDRMFRQAALDPQAQSMAIIEASSSSLLFADVATARDTIQRSLDAADDEDLVYAALWLQLTEQRAGTTNDDTARQALSSVDRSSTWIGTLARWGLGELDDAGLLRRARTLVERSEAEFYVGMRKQGSDPAASRAMLQNVARGPAIDLVETHLARELTLSAEDRAFGTPPVALP